MGNIIFNGASEEQDVTIEYLNLPQHAALLTCTVKKNKIDVEASLTSYPKQQNPVGTTEGETPTASNQQTTP